MSTMTRIIVCGSRDIVGLKVVFGALDALAEMRPITTIISGGARGVDSIAKRYAVHHKINFVEMKADWGVYGRAAGYRRNVDMLNELGEGGVVIAIWDGRSKGTAHMVNIATNKGYEVVVVKVAQ